jgi:glutamate synthase (NADPH/NADH) large chain
VSEAGVGTVAAGVVKAHADAVHIAGHDGGTGASPLSSIHHAGTPWELGLAETQQVLVESGLRSRVRVQVDGQLKTGRDVAFAALLGAEEFGFATAPLVASGCVMMRKCHLNTCPVGIATQDPVLRARFRGTPEHVIRYFFYVAEELRQIMATLGFRTVDEMVGRVEHIVPKSLPGGTLGADKARTLDFGDVLAPPMEDHGPLRCTTKQAAMRPSDLDERISGDARLSLKYREPTTMRVDVTNADRAIGARLAGEIARAFGGDGLPDDTITIEAFGTAGQSFGAFAAKGMLVVLEGDANDYVGKGLSGGTIAALPPRRSRFRACDNVIVGNTVLYGATSGKAFFAGRAGERFAVRNSGATVVVEGVGDHACEYMTGGTVVVLGSTGRNFGAGMSGGIAYVFDVDGSLEQRLNGSTELERSPLDADDAEVVRSLIEEHVRHTRSTRGAALLADFANATRRFVRVLPLEYKRALEKAATG